MIGLVLMILTVDLPPETRIKNNGPNCVWACLDTLAHRHDILPLKGILKERLKKNTLALDSEVEKELREHGTNYIIRKQFSFDRTLLETYTDQYGVSVSLKAGNSFSRNCHQIIVTECGSERVRFYCPDNTHKIWTCGRSWFDTWWLGNSVVVMNALP